MAFPGTVGGGVCMNAGAYGGEMKQVLTCVRILFPEEGVKTLTNEELKLGYRHSILSECPGGRCAVRDHAAASGQGKNDSGYHAGTDA